MYMEAFVFDDFELRTSHARLGIWAQFRWETRAYSNFIYPAFIPATLLGRAPISWRQAAANFYYYWAPGAVAH